MRETEFFSHTFIRHCQPLDCHTQKSSLCFVAVTVWVVGFPNLYFWSVGEPDYCRGGGGTVRVTRLDPLADLERPCCPLLSSNILALIRGVLSGRNELIVV